MDTLKLSRSTRTRMTHLRKPAGAADGKQTSPRSLMTRRSQLEIRIDLLKAIMEGVEEPTQIMYKANLSWILFCDHLTALSEQGFVGAKAAGDRMKYSLTDKGIEIVAAYQNLIREISLDTTAPPI